MYEGMKNATWFIVIVAFIALAGAIVFINSGTGTANGNVINVGSGEVQKVTLGMKNGNYYPNTLTVNAGQPVELALDSSVAGCFRSFTIRELGISQYAKTVSDKITFTLPSAGTYAFACSMGMGSGTLKAI